MFIKNVSRETFLKRIVVINYKLYNQSAEYKTFTRYPLGKVI